MDRQAWDTLNNDQKWQIYVLLDMDVHDLLSARNTAFTRCTTCLRYKEIGLRCQHCGKEEG